jgi:succinate dehydrogenase/fumarate reductase cytochrome b subunit
VGARADGPGECSKTYTLDSSADKGPAVPIAQLCADLEAAGDDRVPCGTMSTTLLKALVALVPLCMLAFWTARVFFRAKTLGSLLQLIGAACLVVVVLTHICEALDLLPWMRWGHEQSPGHYLDLVSAVLGLTLLLIGFLFHTRSRT